MTTYRKRVSKLATLLALGLGGGTMFSTCQTRIKDAFVDGTKDFIATLLSPENVQLLLTPDASESDTDGGV